MSIDPMADSYSSWSPYAYVLNNPVNLIDPTGMCAESGGGPGGPPECFGGNREILSFGNADWGGQMSVGEKISLQETARELRKEKDKNKSNDSDSDSTDPEKRSLCVGLTCDTAITSSVLGAAGISGIGFVSGGISYNIGSVVQNRSAYGTPNPTTILRTPGFYTPNISINTNALRYTGTAFKLAGASSGVFGLGLTGSQYMSGEISGVEASFDTLFGAAGFFWPFGTAASVGYFGGKAFHEYFLNRN